MKLYHRTCSHRIDAILASGTLLPNTHPWLGVKLIWFTSVPSASREALGLSQGGLVTCDRMAHLLEVAEPDHAVPWNVFKRELPASRARLLEIARGTRPEFWWVAGLPQHAELVTERVRHA